MKKKKFNIEGMDCASCQAHLDHEIRKINGISYCNVSLLKNTLEVEYDEEKVNDKLIVSKIKDAGYNGYTGKKVIKKDKHLTNLLISLVFFLFLSYVSMSHMWHLPLPEFITLKENRFYFSLIQLVLVTPIVFIYKDKFINGFKRLFKLSPNMDSLICLGAATSYIYGIFVVVMLGIGKFSNNMTIIDTYYNQLYFESAGMILVFAAVGKYIERLTKRKTSQAIEDLVSLQPNTVVILKDNEEITVPFEEVKKGDIVIVKKGERIAIDGIIIEGSASIDESNLTGESLPVYKNVGQEVISATLVESGYLKIEATKVGEDTTFKTIIKLVEEASNSKAPISKLVDRISLFFVPSVLIISIIVFVSQLLMHLNIDFVRNFESAFNNAVSVLVIACPCALGLATPLAIMISSGISAKHNLLIKNAEILEKIHKANTIVFDKTGTLTNGKMVVSDFLVLEKEHTQEIYDVIYEMEKLSEHPLANPLLQYVTNKHKSSYKISNFESIEGVGLKGYINEDKYIIGNHRSIKDIQIKNDIQKQIENNEKQCKTSLFVTKNDVLYAIINISDNPRKESKYVISLLKKMGKKIYMLTGDNNRVATSLTNTLDIDHVISEVLPKEKSEIINNLKKQNKGLVMMVGDGVNDAIALTTADVGVALGKASDVAIDTSDVVLIGNNLLGIVDALRLSKRTIITVAISLFWAFFYNLISIVIATGFIPGIVINPMIGSIVMACSDIFVVLTAFTLHFFKASKLPIIGKKIDQTYKIEGMSCKHCKEKIENIIKLYPSIESVDISLKNDTMHIIGNDENLDEIFAKIQEAGYTVIVD